HTLVSIWRRPPLAALLPYTTLFRSLFLALALVRDDAECRREIHLVLLLLPHDRPQRFRERILAERLRLPDALTVVAQRVVLCMQDRKSTRLNSSHVSTSYAVFCLRK